MLKTYRNLSFLFFVILILVIAGFYKTYFGLIPHFTGLPKAAHIHALAFLLWIAMLIIQPLLINYKKIEWHRRIGKFSYVLVPFIFYTIFLMAKNQYYRDLTLYPMPRVLAGLSFPFLDVVFFTLFYGIAMFNTKKIRVHVAYIIACSLLLVGPGLGRLMFNLYGQGLPVFLSILIFDYTILISMLIIETRKLKIPFYKSSYFTIILLFLLDNCAGFVLPESSFWQSFAQKLLIPIF